MFEAVSIGVGIGLLIKSTPHWFPAVRDTVISTGKDTLIKKGQERAQTYLDEKKHKRHMELALQNAAERGAVQWQTREERSCYNSVLQILSEGHSEALRQEAMQLFTLSDNPNLADLTEKYNLSQRITALAHHTPHTEVDAGPYLQSFFTAFLSELYNDSLFRAQMSNVIQVRAAMQGIRSLEEIRHTLQTIQGLLSDEYTLQDFQSELENYLEYIEKKYRHHRFAGIVMGENEDKAPELDHIFVQLRVSLLSRDGPWSDYTSSTNLVALLEKHPYLVLLGGPGSGKSTTTCYLAWLHAKASQEASQQAAEASTQNSATLEGHPLPLRIELRLLSEARRQNAAYSFLSYAAQVLLGREHIAVSSKMFEALLERRALVVLFDGLDEVATLSERKQLVEEIERFAQRYPGNRVLVTSRPVGYELASISDPAFRRAEIQSFNDDQIRQFLESWYRYVLRLSPLPAEDQQELELLLTLIEENPRLHELATNPLLLTVITALHRHERLPDGLEQIYDKCANLLLDTWVRLKYERERWKGLKLGKEDQKACLAHLGFVLHHRAQEIAKSQSDDWPYRYGRASDTAVDVPANFLNKELEHFLAQQNVLGKAEQRLQIELLLEMIRSEAGLLVERGTGQNGEPLYGFVHRTFLEYFAALDVWNRYQEEGDATIIREFLAEHVHDPHWQEVTLLLLSKFKPKFASSQLQFILQGKTRRSSYSDILHHDLFFVANCLIDGIDVDQTLAKEIIYKLNKIVRETAFPAQRQEAITALVALRQTQLYADLSKRALQLSQWPSEDWSRQVQVAQAIYTKCPAGSQGRLEAVRLLNKLVQLHKLSFDQALQIAQAICKNSPTDSDERREGTHLLTDRFQPEDLSFEQALQVAQTIFQYSSDGSNEQRAAARLLIARWRKEEPPFEQALQIARAIYHYSPAGSDEQRAGVRLLTDKFQPEDLSIDQAIQMAHTIYQGSSDGSDEQLVGVHLLFDKWQQGNLSFEQALQMIEAIYQNCSAGSNEQREGTRLLINWSQHKDLSIDQAIQMAHTIYQNSPDGSDDQRTGARLLLDKWQWANLSFEEALRIGLAIYQYSPAGSDERREGVRLLLAVVQTKDGLYVDPARQVAQTIYQYSPSGSTEQQMGVQLLIGWFQDYQISIEQAIQIARAISQYSPTGSDEKQKAAHLLITKFQPEDLSIEQALQMAQAIYQLSPNGSDEQCEGARLLIDKWQQEDLSFEQALQVAQTIYQYSPDGSDEQRQGAWLLIDKWQQELPVEQALQMVQTIWSACSTDSVEHREATRLLIEKFPPESLSIKQAIQIAQLIFLNSQTGLDDQLEGTRLLIEKFQLEESSIEQALQVAQTIYQYSPAGSDEQRDGAWLLIDRWQREDPAFEQALQIAQAIYRYSPADSVEHHEAARLLIEKFPPESLSIKQATKIAQTIYENSPTGSDEQSTGVRLLLDKWEQEDLAFEQVLQIAQAIYQYSPAGSDEQQMIVRLLLDKWQWEALAFDQVLQMAQAIYRYSPEGSIEQYQGTRLLLAWLRQQHLSIDEALQIAQIISRSSPTDSDEQYELVRLLIKKFQREKLSIDQVCRLVNTIYQVRQSDSDEPREGFRLLIEKLQPTGLSIDHVMQIARNFYDSSIGPDERCEIAQWLIEKFQPTELSIDQALQIARTIYRYGPAGSLEKRKGAWLLNELVHHNKLSADQALEFYRIFTVEEMRRYEDDIPVIPAFVKLAMQEAIPLSTRDRFYQMTLSMVPLFVEIDATRTVAKND